MPGPANLTEQMRKFAEAFVACGSASKAAEIAGYAHPNKVGTRLAQKPLILDEVARLRAKLEARRDPKAIADAEEIQATLTRIARGEEPDYSLSLSGETVEGKARLETRRKALMDLAKLQGLLVDKAEVGTPGEFKRYEEMSATELREAALRLAKVGK